MESLLIEIGAEEIPAGYIQPALDALSANLLKKLSDARIAHGAATVYGTPRRLAVKIADVAPKQKSVTTEVVGPPAKVGFDAEGNPTVAAEKFAEKVGVPVSRITRKETEKGTYLCVKKTERGISTGTFLKRILPEVILATPFPKRMRWADLSIEFARPIFSIMALYGEKVISFAVENLKSGRTVRGHSFMHPERIKISHPEAYIGALRGAGVVADIGERRQMTADRIEIAARAAGGRVLPDEELLDTVTNLVENPLPVVGNFETKFLELPSEILITAMREHQKYFAVVDDTGRLLPSFIAVNNTETKDMNLVARGHERVIRARLEDARFFYGSDMRASFEDWVGKLNGVLFQAKLGSMYEKVMRVEQVGRFLSDAAGVDETTRSHVVRAARLCKADLVSQVVGEFPKLQGVMGRVYAAVKKEPDAVASAIEEHYRPVRSGGTLPARLTGALVAIADKIDSICGCFSVGLVPTGAADPYALRRQGIGIIQIMLDKGLTCSLRQLIEKSLDLFGDKREMPVAETVEKVYSFLQNRIGHLLAEEGFSKDVIAAIVDVSVDNVPDTWNRVRALEALKRAPDFEPLAVAFKRVVNIIRQAGESDTGRIDPSLFEHESESALYAAYRSVSESVAESLDRNAFDMALKEIATLRDPVDAFFDGVMVLTEDAAVRRNRLALLGTIAALFGRMADFSKISI